MIEDGRAAWKRVADGFTDAGGSYRFFGLKPGTYVVVSEWLFDFRDPGSAPSDLEPGQDLWLKPGEKLQLAVTEPAVE